MDILADESIDRQIVDSLRENGFSVTYIAEMNPGITDKEVFQLALEKVNSIRIRLLNKFNGS